MADALVDDIDSILAIPHRRDDGADMRFQERSLGELTRPARSNVEHLHDWRDVIGDGKRCGGRLRGVLKQGVSGVHIQIEIIRHVRRHAAARIPADIG